LATLIWTHCNITVSSASESWVNAMESSQTCPPNDTRKISLPSTERCSPFFAVHTTPTPYILEVEARSAFLETESDSFFFQRTWTSQSADGTQIKGLLEEDLDWLTTQRLVRCLSIIWRVTSVPKGRTILSPFSRSVTPEPFSITSPMFS
jgi:hypothetical protein